MCYAGSCHPECDGCQPKYIICPQCDTRQGIGSTECCRCGRAFNERDRENAVDEWRRTHISRY